MLDQKNNIILIIIFFIILLSIISALIIEHALGHKPCSLCIYERIPYFLSALLLIKIFFFKKYEKITLLKILSKKQLLKELNQNVVSCKDVTCCIKYYFFKIIF